MMPFFTLSGAGFFFVHSRAHEMQKCDFMATIAVTNKKIIKAGNFFQRHSQNQNITFQHSIGSSFLPCFTFF